ncbi:MAG: oligosaccharide flippase family protein, partial [Thermoleophilaceae bacterium]|nr:oligosaccharide flippase family protein [Thermoleophilaceae bacterium]
MASEAQPAPRALKGGAVWTAGAQVAVAGAGAVVSVIVARALGPGGAGSFALALSLFLMLQTLGTLGIDLGIIYLVASRRWAPRRAWLQSQGAALALGLAGAGVGIAARLLAPDAFKGLSVALVIVTVAALPFALSWIFGASVALARDAYEGYALPYVVQAGAMVLGVGVLAALYGLEGAVIGLAASQVVAALAMGIRSARVLDAAEDSPPMLREATRFGFKAYLANALQFVNYRLDLFILAAVAGASAAGYYAVAIAITSGMWLLPQALSLLVFPRVAALSAAGAESEEYREVVEVKSVRHVSLLMVVSAIVLALLMAVVLTLIYGERFQPAVELGLILLPGVTLIGIANVLSATIVGRGRPELSLYIALITTPITIGLYVLLVPWLEGPGAALASSISYSLNFVLAAFFYGRVTGRA